jgi:type IV pilus assembly protein PilW
MIRPNKSYYRSFQQQGFSLIEIMIGIVLSSILILGLAELFGTSSANATAAAGLSGMQETGRAALQVLTADIRRAGYLGGVAPSASIGGSLDEAPQANACVANTTNWGRMIAQPIYGVNDTNTGYACVADAEYLRGDLLTIRYTDPSAVPTASLVANRPYFRTSLADAKIFLGKDVATAQNTISDQSSRVLELVSHTYFVGPSGRSCQGSAIPSLFRKSISDTGLPTSEELIPGVEHVQFKFLMGNQYVDANDVGLWSTVISVETSVLVRTECPEGSFSNNRTFSFGDLAAAYGPADNHRRQLFTSVTTIRN